MKQLGVILALLSAAAWAFWGVFGKLSANRGMPATTLAGILFALLSGLCGAIGLLFFAMAIKRGDAAIIVTLSAIYPAFTVLLSPLLLQEKLSLTHAIGVLLVTLGVVL